MRPSKQITACVVMAFLCALGIVVALVLRDRVPERGAEIARCRHASVFSGLWERLWSYGVHKGGLPDPVVRDAFGQVLYSWRAGMLPFAMCFNEPLNQGVPWYWRENHLLADRHHPLFCYTRNVKENPESLENHVWAVTGQGTAFDPKTRHRLKDLPANCILLIEAGATGRHWMDPRDLDVDCVPEGITEGTDGTGVVVLFADGEAWFLDRSVPLVDLQKFFTIDGARRSDRMQLLSPYCRAMSRAPRQN